MHNNPIRRQYSKALDAIHWFFLLLITVCISLAWWKAILPTSLWISLLLSVWLIGHYSRRQHITLKSPRAIVCLEPPITGNEWRLWQTNGICHLGYLCGDSIRLSWVILLHFKLIGGGQRVVLFLPSQMAMEAYKKLQLRLRFQYEHNK